MIEVIGLDEYVAWLDALPEHEQFMRDWPDRGLCGAVPPPSAVAGVEASADGYDRMTGCYLPRHAEANTVGTVHASLLLRPGEPLVGPLGLAHCTAQTWQSTRQLGQVVAP